MSKEPAKTEPTPAAEQRSSSASASASAPAPAPVKKGRFVTVGIVGGLMLIEGVGVFAVMKFFGAEPDPTHGLEHALAPTTRPWEESQEIPIAQIRIPNSNGSRTTLYNVRVVIRVHHDNVERIKQFMESRKSTIEDAIGRVIRSADERHLGEPGLETLKRQVKFELSTLLGDEKMIEQVLIPECMPLATGF